MMAGTKPDAPLKLADLEIEGRGYPVTLFTENPRRFIFESTL